MARASKRQGIISNPLPICGKRSLHLSLDTPLVFEIKVGVGNPQKWPLSLLLLNTGLVSAQLMIKRDRNTELDLLALVGG